MVAKKNAIDKIKNGTNSLLKRRPHRSFRLTKRRDTGRPLDIPGYWAFTKYVRKTLWDNRKTFILLAVVYAALTYFLVGIASQETYQQVQEVLNNASGGAYVEFLKATSVFAAALSGSFSDSLTETQQLYAIITILLTWLTTVWLLRNILAGNKVKLRDGLYNAGAPILSTFLVAMVFLIQLLPIAFALIAYVAASTSGLLNGGVEAMLFWIAAGLLSTLSIYWVTSTFFALVVVTLPGMYPLKALTTAGDLVVGRRVRILLRLVWMIVGVLVVWAAVMIPMIMFDSWVKGIWTNTGWVPLVPFTLLALGSLTAIWVSSYVYLLYRKVVDDGSAPA